MKNNYKLNYKEYMQLRQATFIIKQKYDTTHTIKPTYEQMLKQILKQYNKAQLLQIIEQYQPQIQEEKEKYKQQLKEKQEEHLKQIYQKQIIITQLKQPTPEQLNHMIVRLQELEKQFYLQLDIDYSDEQSIKLAYQQVLYYNYYKIPIQRRETKETLIGNLEILDNPNIDKYQDPETIQDIIQNSQNIAMSI